MENDEAVKAAAKTLYRESHGEWKWADEIGRQAYLRDAEEALEAAYPHIAKQVLAAARKRVEAWQDTLDQDDEAGYWQARVGDEVLAAIGGQDTGEEEKEVDDGE